MKGFCRVLMIGNLTRDPEMRFTQKGMAIAAFGMAINRTWKNEAGETKEEVTFVDCSAFGKIAETLGQYMKKGSPLFVEGRLKQDSWEDKQTQQKKTKLSVVIEGFNFVGGNTEGGAPAPARAAAPAAAKPPRNQPPPEGDNPDEDNVPF